MSNPIVVQPLKSEQIDPENPEELPNMRRVKRKSCWDRLSQCFAECCEAVGDCCECCDTCNCCDDDYATRRNMYYINNDDNNVWNTGNEYGLSHDHHIISNDNDRSTEIHSGHHGSHYDSSGHHDSGGHCDSGGGNDGGGDCGDGGGGGCDD